MNEYRNYNDTLQVFHFNLCSIILDLFFAIGARSFLSGSQGVEELGGNCAGVLSVVSNIVISERFFGQGSIIAGNELVKLILD